MSALLQDVRYGLRRLIQQPGFTAVALLTLALGIGANTAIFSAVHAVLLQSLPVRDPDRLVLFDDSPGEGTMVGDPATGPWQYYSYPSYRYIRAHTDVFEGLAAFRSGTDPVSVVGEGGADGPAQLGSAHLVSGNWFEVVGAHARLGRVLTSADDSAGAPAAAVISDGYWRTRLGADPAIIGRKLTLNGTPVTVVGVMPPDFFGLTVRRAPDYWLPLQLQPRIGLTAPLFDTQSVYWLNLVGRLRPGATRVAAQAQATRALREFLTGQAGSEVSAERQQGIARTSVALGPGARGISVFRYFYARSLYVLLGVVGLVLLIACANIANLLLARAATRQGEVAVRLALGATRGRLVRQLLTEGVLLAVGGGALGLLFADWGVHLLVSQVSSTAPLDVGVSPLVLGYTAVIALAAGVVFSLAPALRSAGLNLGGALRERSHGGARGRVGLASTLVASQVAISLVLLLGAGLLGRSLANMEGQDLGFERSGVLLVGLEPRLGGYRAAELEGLYRRLMDRVGAVPGVRAVTVAGYSPLGGTSQTSDITVAGYTPRSADEMMVGVNPVGPRYPDVLGVRLRSGRAITAEDGPGAPRVAMVNEAFARAYFPGADPVGRRFQFGDGRRMSDGSPAPEYEIVGVLPDVRFQGVEEPARRMVYTGLLQSDAESAAPAELEVRTAGDPAQATAVVRAAIAEVDSRLPIARVTTLTSQVDGSLRQARLLARLVGFFGALAMALACVGLYGVVAQSVARRTNELGIRMALGADGREILAMVLRETAILVLSGLVVGVPAALAGSQVIRSQLFGVAAWDPLTLAGAVLLLLAVAGLAGAIPAWRAARVDPITALRYE